MKKLVGIVAGVCLVAGLSAQAQGPVYSKNVVGFQKIDLAPGLNMIANNWNAVGGKDSISIQDVLDTTELVAGTQLGNSDVMYVWDPSLFSGQGGYVLYYFGDFAGVYGPEYDRKWYEFGNDAEPTTNAIMRGQGFWLRHSGTGASTALAGEVPAAATKDTVFGLGLTMFGASYTANLPLNGDDLVWDSNGGTQFGNSDVIYVWDTSLAGGQGGYLLYYFGDFGGVYGAEYDNKWYEFGNDAEPTPDEISMGAGAWYRNIGPSSATLTENKPYTL